MTNELNHNNIVLIGMSGVGKTTVGKYISQNLNMEFIDTDNLIIESTGRTIDYLFEKHGENFFRELEANIINRIYSYENKVISTGGGIVLNDENVNMLRKNGIIFFLTASIETIYIHLASDSQDNHRPLLKNSEDLFEKIKNLYEERENLYISSADYIVKVDRKPLNNVGDEIISIFKSLYSCS